MRVVERAFAFAVLPVALGRRRAAVGAGALLSRRVRAAVLTIGSKQPPALFVAPGRLAFGDRAEVRRIGGASLSERWDVHLHRAGFDKRVGARPAQV